MFSGPPEDFARESWAAWRAGRKEAEEEKSAASTREETPLAVATPRPHENKRVCLFTEEDLNQPAAARKKPPPAEVVSFF